MSDIVTELTELNQAFAKAELAADLEFFRYHVADGLRFRRQSGKIVDKDSFLKDLSAPENANERIKVRNIEVLPYGADLALCLVDVDFRGVRGGEVVKGLFRNTRVFVRSAGVWKCALWFNTKELE